MKKKNRFFDPFTGEAPLNTTTSENKFTPTEPCQTHDTKIYYQTLTTTRRHEKHSNLHIRRNVTFND